MRRGRIGPTTICLSLYPNRGVPPAPPSHPLLLHFFPPAVAHLPCYAKREAGGGALTELRGGEGRWRHTVLTDRACLALAHAPSALRTR